MGGWGNEESIYDYTVLYGQSVHSLTHSVKGHPGIKEHLSLNSYFVSKILIFGNRIFVFRELK